LIKTIRKILAALPICLPPVIVGKAGVEPAHTRLKDDVILIYNTI